MKKQETQQQQQQPQPPHTPRYTRLQKMDLDLYTREVQIENRTLTGKALLNKEKGEFIFAQNAPRGARSIEIGRTRHSRFVRRPDGDYTVTFSALKPDEKNLLEQLLAEMREITTKLKKDHANRNVSR